MDMKQVSSEEKERDCLKLWRTPILSPVGGVNPATDGPGNATPGDGGGMIS